MYWLLKRGLSAAAGEAAEGEQQEEEEEGSHGELGSSDRTSGRWLDTQPLSEPLEPPLPERQ